MNEFNYWPLTPWFPNYMRPVVDGSYLTREGPWDPSPLLLVWQEQCWWFTNGKPSMSRLEWCGLCFDPRLARIENIVRNVGEGRVFVSRGIWVPSP